MKRRRRIAAYGLCRDETGRVLLVRGGAGVTNSGRWFLPGGGVEHGEHPADAVVREVAEETGLRVAVEGIRDVLTDIDYLPKPPILRHHDRIIFDVRVLDGALRDEQGGSSDRAAWVAVEALGELPLMPYVGRVLGVATPANRAGRVHGAFPALALSDRSLRWLSVKVRRVSHRFRTLSGLRTNVVSAVVPTRRQRFAAYGLVTDPTGNVLLTQIADGYPGAGRWHLPGGGTDFGESAADGLAREIVEETDQRGQVNELISVSHRHQSDALGPEGVPIDWHGVRVVFRAFVEAPTSPRVMEDHGGSTVAASWFSPAQARTLPLTEIARDMIAKHLSYAQ